MNNPSLAYSLAEKMSTYESVEFTISGVSSNYDVAANQTGAFGGALSKLTTVGKERGLIRIITDQTITVKYNDTANPAITITSSESPYYEVALNVRNMFITTTTSTNLKIVLYYI